MKTLGLYFLLLIVKLALRCVCVFFVSICVLIYCGCCVSSRVSRQLWSSEQSLASSPGVESQSVSQFLLLQKLSLLKLTALMDKYSPCSKQGWNW